MKTIQKTLVKNVISGLLSLSFTKRIVYGDCQSGKKTHALHKQISQSSSMHILELFHLNLMELMQLESLGGKHYVLVVVDDFSH